MNELVSIIMPSYNTGQYIKAAIQSVVSQTYPNWELIIVDDCSTDNTEEIVSGFLADSRIKYLKNEHKSGAALARNYALREAAGRWIAFLDSDDMWFPDKLQKQLDFMEKNNYAFTCTDYCVDCDGVRRPYIYTSPDVINKRKMYNYCYFSTITVMYDKNIIGLIQIESIEKNNDYAMWLQIIEKSNCYRFSECLSVVNKHENSISSGSKLMLIKWHYILFRSVMKKNVFVAAVLTANNLFHGVIKKIIYKKKVGTDSGVFYESTAH